MDIRTFQQDPSVAATLRSRAELLAAQEATTDEERDEDVLIFRLGEGRYRLPIGAVREVVPLQRYTPLPATPPFMVGLVNVRGWLLPLLDLRPLLQLPAARPDGYVLIVNAGTIEVGLLADEVVEVARHSRELVATPAAAAGRAIPWVRGVDPELRLVIDPTVLLADPQLIVDAGRA
jgi:purine-binding chemotaxis protein CheW